jgi:hypothetical protein
MEVICSSETLADIQRTTGCYILEVDTLQTEDVFMRFEIFMVVTMKFSVFWYVTLCSVLDINVLEELAISIFWTEEEALGKGSQ